MSFPCSGARCLVRERSEEVLANELALFRGEVLGQGRSDEVLANELPLFCGVMLGQGEVRGGP